MSPQRDRGPLVARRVRQAVDAAERMICGEGAADSLAFVEGLALAGRRAARLLEGGWPYEHGGVLEAPWVDHRVASSRTSAPLAFELAALTGQQAVDHCLVAHRLAAYLGRPGRCTIDWTLAESLELLRLPSADSIATLPSVLGSRIADPIAAARVAFEEVERTTGRTLDRSMLLSLDHVSARALRESLPADKSSSPSRPRPTADPVAIAGLAAGLPVEELLLDSVSQLEPPDAPLIDLRGEHAVPIVTVGESHDDDRPLDLLFAIRPSALVGVALLERLKECGTLLVRARSEDPAALWAALHADQRAVIVRRRLRLAIAGPEIDKRESLSGAIVAALPALGRAAGIDGDALEHLAPLARSGAAALIVIEPSRLAEPTADERQADPRLPRPASSGATPDPARCEQLRQFHFAGIAADGRAPDPLLEEPLVPALLSSPELELTEEPPALDGGLLEHWLSALLEDRRRKRAARRTEVGALAERLRGLLGLPSGPGPAALAASLGAIGADFVDAAVLGERVSRPRHSTTLDEVRTSRLQLALHALEHGLQRTHREPTAYLFYSDADGIAAALPDDVRAVGHPDGLRAAVGLFDGLAAESVVLSRAVRIARLELAGEYDDATHGPVLARLDRSSLTDEELFALPAIAALESARHLRGPALAGLSELIRAGRPVHVLVSESVSGLGARPGYHPGLGYLAVAHRETLVVESSLGRPDHLAAGLERARTALDPVVIVAAVPVSNSDVSSQRQLEVALQGRATPCFVYDPSGGVSWAERFTLDGNPQGDQAWPLYPVPVRDETEHFTFAHAAALDPAWRAHFLVIDCDSWSEEQIEIAEYLELSERERTRRLPFLWVVESGQFARAVIRWELTFACRDRARAWRILQELAGTDNVYARRAAEEARQAVQQESDQRVEQIESDFAVALEAAQGRGAENAVHRLVRLLADPGAYEAATRAVAEGAAPSPLPLPPPLPTPAPMESPAAQPASEVAADESAHIDSFLCTTCNDCTDLNPRMFRYNADKQAEIADLSAGTFEQLVKAAEKCPARCIHPGTPREGDKSATAKLIARAAKYR